MNEPLYNFINEPNSKRRDLLNLAIENIGLIQRTDALKEIRERKLMIMESLKEEMAITHKAIAHFEKFMPMKVKEKQERFHDKAEKGKIKIEQQHKVEKLDELGMELEDIKRKLNNLSF